MKLVMTETKTKRRYVGEVLDRYPSPEAPPPPSAAIDPESLKGLATSSYFNLNAASYLSLPAHPGILVVQVEFGGVFSNEVVIEIK